ncbi:MAG TPA: amino acid permease [Candidatus Angelobacter sp.]
MASIPQPAGTGELVRGVRRWDLVALMINCIIGAGIFGLPSQIYFLTGAYSLFAFAACALVMAVMAICYAEVSSRFTATGGPYLYAREAFGPLVGFQVGWIAWLARFGTMAFVSNVFVSYLGFFWPAVNETGWRVAVISLIFVTLATVNVLGVTHAARLSDFLSVAKVAPMVLFIATGLFFINPHSYSFAAPPALGPFSLAISQLFFAFSGVDLGTIATGEARDPRRNMPFAILTALGIVVVLYILIQVVCIGTLPNLASSQKPLADASVLFLGPAGASIITAGVLVSAAGNMSAGLLGGSRLPFAMAQNSEVPPIFGWIHPRFHTPWVGIVATAGAALALACTGTFRYTLALASISKLITFAVSCATLPVLRRRPGAPPAVVRAPAGIALSAAAVLLSAWLIANSGWPVFRDVCLVAALGFVIYFSCKLRRQRTPASD